jgi:hypothetical protein
MPWSLLFFCPFVHSSVIFRKSVVSEQTGFYNEALAYSQDYELWRRIGGFQLRTYPSLW